MKPSLKLTPSDLPQTDTTIPNNKELVIESENGLYKRDLESLRFDRDNLEQANIIENTINNLTNTSQRFDSISSTIQKRIPFRGAIAAYFNFNPSSNLDFVINRQTNFPLPLNHVAANSTESTGDLNILGLLINNGVVIPKGTYRCRAASTFTVRNPGRYYEEEDVFVGDIYGCNLITDLFQYDSPQRSMLVSDVKHVPVNGLLGKTTITSIIDGYFHVCRTTPIGLRVSTDGNVSIGDGSLNVNVQPKPSVDEFSHYYGNSWPIQLTLELIDVEDIFNLLSVNYQQETDSNNILVTE
jgi:hypothetical protein